MAHDYSSWLAGSRPEGGCQRGRVEESCPHYGAQERGEKEGAGEGDTSLQVTPTMTWLYPEPAFQKYSRYLVSDEHSNSSLQ